MALTVEKPKATFLDMSGYQWTVLFAAWLGWGFDVFDGLLFNFVAPNCVPHLLHITPGTPASKAATLQWTGIVTAVLLFGWAVGGVLFGEIADRIGRTKTLLLTMLLYSLGTAACAFAPNMTFLIVFRFIASLGIGGEWAAGASMVAEVVPEKRRIESGALLYTSAPCGLFLAAALNKLIAGGIFKDHPEVSWRYVFLSGLLPAIVALVVRMFVKEPERWSSHSSSEAKPTISELFSPEFRKITLSGFIPSLTVLITWWSCNAFIQVLATFLAQSYALSHGLSTADKVGLIETWKTIASNAFNWGGLIGTLLTIPAAKFLGRRMMFAVYFVLSAAAILIAFGHPWPPLTLLWMFFPIGLTIFGVFGSFTFYLPELFPTRLRATGAGFCYNIGRLVTVAGPILVGQLASHGVDALHSIIRVLFFIGFVPLVGLLFLPWVIETKGKALAD